MRITRIEKEELNRLLYILIELRDGKRCLKCGRIDTLNLAHIYPKGKYRKMEFDEDNLMFLCFNHHFHWAHKNPREFDKWLEIVLPKERLQRIDLMAQTTIRTPLDYNAIRLYLEDEIKKYD